MELGPRPHVSRGPPLDKWEEFLDQEGRVKDPEGIRELVFKGVRRVLWFQPSDQDVDMFSYC